MAVTRADKEAELQQLEVAFRGSDSAILVDYKGLNEFLNARSSSWSSASLSALVTAISVSPRR